MESKVMFLRGKKVRLRPYHEATDLSLFTKWINDPNVKRFVGTRPFPISESVEREQMEKMVRSSDTVFCVIETFEGTTIGTVGLHRINWVDRTATLGIMIGEERHWGKGYGTDTEMQILNYAFSELNLHAIRASVIAFNPRSLKVALKQGFKEVGRHPAWFYRNGKRYDEILLVLTKDDFMRAWSVYNVKK